MARRLLCTDWALSLELEGRMDWQQIASLAIVAVTTVLLIGREIRRRRRPLKRACGGGCDCAEKPGPMQHLNSTDLPA
jgi:hypothetical protein